MKTDYKTERLLLTKLTLNDADFIFELVNTTAWIKFIGDRNIHTNEDAINYIKKIISNPDINYRVVRLKENQNAMGVITFIKRDYLAHHDIGFAFLPQHAKHGYAFEAASAVLNELPSTGNHSTILATTLKDNAPSIQLLIKLGLVFEKEIHVENEILHVYAIYNQKKEIAV